MITEFTANEGNKIIRMQVEELAMIMCKYIYINCTILSHLVEEELPATKINLEESINTFLVLYYCKLGNIEILDFLTRNLLDNELLGEASNSQLLNILLTMKELEYQDRNLFEKIHDILSSQEVMQSLQIYEVYIYIIYI